MIELTYLALNPISYNLKTVLERSSKNLTSGIPPVGEVRSGATLYERDYYYWPNVVFAENGLGSRRLVENVFVRNS